MAGRSCPRTNEPKSYPHWKLLTSLRSLKSRRLRNSYSRSSPMFTPKAPITPKTWFLNAMWYDPSADEWRSLEIQKIIRHPKLSIKYQANRAYPDRQTRQHRRRRAYAARARGDATRFAQGRNFLGGRAWKF